MKKLYYQINSMLQFMAEFLCSISYIGFIISAVLILCNALTPKQTTIYTISLIFHLFTIAFCGNLSTERKSNKKPWFIPFVFINIVLMISVIVITKSLIAIPLYIGLTIINIFYIHITDCLTCFTASKKRPKLETIFEKNLGLWYLIFLIIPIIAIIIPLVFLHLNIFIKIGIVLSYIIAMPFIAILADNGFDIRYIYE